jgi:xanthine dehydrogenase YagS FAD-binding subunit
MRPFFYERPESAEEAVRAVGAHADAAAHFIAGGTTMTDLMKLEVMQPEWLVDINDLARDRYGRIEASEAGLRLGALVRMGEAHEHPAIRQRYPVIAESLQLAASQQIRNMASLGGNVLQRTRCEYFRETSWACNKRRPGSGCSALEGINREHAILGTSEHCIATYPGDFAQALIALDATVDILGGDGHRQIPFSELHVQPGGTPDIETTLAPDELVLGFEMPVEPWMRRSLYLKIRDRESYEFALASAAVALELTDGAIRQARIALGGVATVPWRAREAERALIGRAPDEAACQLAADIAFSGARPKQYNAFKPMLGRETIVRALMQAAAMEA